MSGQGGGIPRDERPAPMHLPGGDLVVPGALAAELTAALEVYVGVASGVLPPAACRVPRVGRAVLAILTESRKAAAQHRRVETQRANAAASAPIVTVVASAQIPSASSQEITSGDAAVVVGVSEARVRQLAAAGAIRGRKGPRDTWLLDSADCRAYAARRRMRRPADVREDPPRTEHSGEAGRGAA